MTRSYRIENLENSAKSTNFASKMASSPATGPMVRRSISILIPVYNQDCTGLVEELMAQGEALPGIEWEVCVTEDGSTDPRCLAANRRLSTLPLCRYTVREENIGRARIRNLLAAEARYPWLLFIDSHLRIEKSDFLLSYLQAPEAQVVDGDYEVPESEEAWGCHLRYRYERQCASQHTVEARRTQPYGRFHTANFLISKQLCLDLPFVESFREYGYEDVLFGAQLEKTGIEILHIDNPVVFGSFETNARFVEKSEAALRSLSSHEELLKDHSRMLAVYHRLHRAWLSGIFACAYHLFGRSMRRHLVSARRPRLWLFNAYRLCYFCECRKKEKKHST